MDAAENQTWDGIGASQQEGQEQENFNRHAEMTLFHLDDVING